jgi:hypothetical protein
LTKRKGELCQQWRIVRKNILIAFFLQVKGIFYYLNIFIDINVQKHLYWVLSSLLKSVTLWWECHETKRGGSKGIGSVSTRCWIR